MCNELAKVQKQEQKFELPQFDNEGMIIMDFVQATVNKKTLPTLAFAKQTVEHE